MQDDSADPIQAQLFISALGIFSQSALHGTGGDVTLSFWSEWPLLASIVFKSGTMIVVRKDGVSFTYVLQDADGSGAGMAAVRESVLRLRPADVHCADRVLAKVSRSVL
jgi:hypothetical protein